MKEIETLVVAKLAELKRGADYFELLGVSRSASDQELQAAYFELARKLHPDRLRMLDLPPDATSVFAAINQGFGVLGHPKKRSGYLEELAAGGREAKAKADSEVEQLAAKLFGAEDAFQKGLSALRRNAMAEARARFEEAVELNPDEGEHHALLAWAIWCGADDKAEVKKAVRKLLARAIAISPKSVPAHLYRGRIAKQQGNTEGAIECFQKVLTLSPGHQDAQDAKLELRLLTNRQEGDKEKKGGLFSRRRRR